MRSDSKLDDIVKLPTCADCGGYLTSAFHVATGYVRCVRCGHVFRAGVTR